MARNIIINPNRGLTGATTNPEIRFSGATSGSISLKVEDDGTLTFEGSTGGLFSIEDDKDGLLHGVSDVSGLPIFSVYSDNRVEMGKWDDLAMTIADNQVFIGPSATTVSLLHISGGSFTYKDGNEAANKIMVSDADGVVSWAPLVWTGNTSGDCITDIYATNIIGCSPLNLNNSMTVEDNGNVGIGTLTADTTLHVLGAMTLEGQNFYVDNVNSTNDIRFRATDSVGHPYYTAFGFGPTGQENQISTDSTVGFQIGLGTSNRFRFTSTSATHLALTLNGSLLGFDFASNTAITSHRFGTVGAEGGKVWLNAQGYTTGDVQIEGGSDANLLFTDASTDRVGIGTATPTAKLHVKGTGDTSASNTFLLQNSGGTTTMVVEDGGNVGIGTAAPTDTLHVNGVTGSTQFRLEQSFTPSSSGDTAGNVGSVAWDDTYLYTKTNTGWGRTIWDYTF